MTPDEIREEDLADQPSPDVVTYTQARNGTIPLTKPLAIYSAPNTASEPRVIDWFDFYPPPKPGRDFLQDLRRYPAHRFQTVTFCTRLDDRPDLEQEFESLPADCVPGTLHSEQVVRLQHPKAVTLDGQYPCVPAPVNFDQLGRLGDNAKLFTRFPASIPTRA